MPSEYENHFLANNMLYSCADSVRRGSEQFVAEHALGYIISGESHIDNASGKHVYGAGTIGLVRRNQLLKSYKVPPPGGEFRSINIFLTREVLHQYSTKHDIKADIPLRDSYIMLTDPFIKGYFDSLLPYFSEPSRLTDSLIALKTQEAIELLLRHNPALKNILFDFSEPHKIDLEAFMQQNYRYNVSMDRFAQLTGRSLAAFKRDFEHVFQQSPGKWLQEKRLSEAHYLIKEKGKKPSEIYLEVGFENLSHFSYAFKKQFGMGPSLV